MVSVNYVAIGQRIKEKRKEAGLNQKELAVKVGLSEASISKYEHGKVEDATHAMLTKFAEALGVSVAWLLGMEGKAKVTPATSLSPEERRLVDIFRSLDHSGKDYVLQTLEMAESFYKEAAGKMEKDRPRYF